MKTDNVVLASNSPRRRQLLSLVGWPFKVVPADIDESQRPGERPSCYVLRLAREKAQAISQDHIGLVIAADTIVVDQGELLGKPAGAAEARQMLCQLRGRTHQVFTGIALVQPSRGRAVDDLCRVDVPMRSYTHAEIVDYVATGDPLDKAGAYAIQHAGFHPVAHLKGCFASVMGLPLCHLKRLLDQWGHHTPDDLPQRCQAHLDYACPVFQQILGWA